MGWGFVNPPMSKTIAITGGIGSGKSYVCRILADSGLPLFYADPEAKHIVRHHPDVRRALIELVGPEVYDAQGQLVKSVLAAYLCQGREYSKRVDEIVHPRVAEAWRAFVAQHPLAERVGMECALLYESGLDREVDCVVHVSCPDEERMRRVMARDGIDRATAQRWMALQMPEAEKAQRAHIVIVNDGQADVEAQLRAHSLLVSSSSSRVG